MTDAYDDTLQHIALINAKLRTLYDCQAEAETQIIHRIACDFEAGRIGTRELYDVFMRLKATAADGFNKRWSARFPDQYNAHRMRYVYLNLPDPDGNWRGLFPLGPTEVAPPAGQSVVYVLFDAANAPCYVGSTEHLRARLKNHADNGKQFARWLAYPCADREAAYLLEERLLSEHKPYLNRRCGR